MFPLCCGGRAGEVLCRPYRDHANNVINCLKVSGGFDTFVLNHRSLKIISIFLLRFRSCVSYLLAEPASRRQLYFLDIPRSEMQEQEL